MKDKSNTRYKQIGNFKYYTFCRFCSARTYQVINLGVVPLAGGFLKSIKNFNNEQLFPLNIAFCKNCYLLQVMEVISAKKLFQDYFYHSSSINTLVVHFQKLAHEFLKLLTSSKNRLVVEIGCNDGTFLNACKNLGFEVIGIDPAANIVKPLIEKGAPIINAYFTVKTAKEIIRTKGKADLIFSSNTLAHIENLHEVFNGIEYLLKDEGILVFENHYLGNLIKEMQYDMIYHEHQYYYSVHALKNFLALHKLEIFDLKFIPIHAGSISVFVQRKGGKRKIKKIVGQTLIEEKKNKLTDISTFKQFNNEMLKTKKELIKLLNNIKKNGKSIAGYGASGRGTIMMNYCGIDNDILDYIIDDAPAKQGAYTPGTHLKIKPSTILTTKNRPDYILLFAWSFFDEIIKRNQIYIKNGGKFIVPLPKVKIIS